MVPPVSLVIPVYNRQRYLALTIKSILAQTYPYFELLVWDDGSSDLSTKIARYHALRDSRIRLIEAPHQGVAASLQSAIASTTGQYIGWVDSDDLLAPHALAETVATLERQSEIGLVYSDYLVIDEQGKEHGLGSRCRIPYSRERLLIDFMVFHFRLMRRSLYEQVGGINPLFERAEDYDLVLRLSEVAEFRHLRRSLYSYRRHADNVTNHQAELQQWAHKACTAALSRRGLDQTHWIDVTKNGEFILHCNSSQSSGSSFIR
jgi:glycosyltransferase involved in cell wall biosynthesis